MLWTSRNRTCIHQTRDFFPFFVCLLLAWFRFPLKIWFHFVVKIVLFIAFPLHFIGYTVIEKFLILIKGEFHGNMPYCWNWNTTRCLGFLVSIVLFFFYFYRLLSYRYFPFAPLLVLLKAYLPNVFFFNFAINQCLLVQCSECSAANRFQSYTHYRTPPSPFWP